MSNEIQFSFTHNATCYALIRNNQTGQVWRTDTTVFETYLSANYSKYINTAAEQGTGVSAFFAGNFPVQIAPGTYGVTAKQQLGGSPAESDPTIAGGNIEWNGLNYAPLSDTATSGQVGTFLPQRLFRGQMIKNFPIYLVGSADHVSPLTSGVVSGQISQDGGAFQALQSGAITEVGQGVYNLQALTSGDLLCNTATLLFNAVNLSGGSADPHPYSLILNRSSGQLG